MVSVLTVPDGSRPGIRARQQARQGAKADPNQDHEDPLLSRFDNSSADTFENPEHKIEPQVNEKSPLAADV